MAYVVGRPKGRFEIRESLHTAAGPRARSLAGFDVLSDEVLAKAARRAQRPFDAGAVLASGRRAGAPVTAVAGGGHESGATREHGARPAARGPRESGATHEPGARPAARTRREARESPARFVEASRRAARAFQRPPRRGPADPGATLIELLGFADAVTRGQPARPFAPLEFPVLSGLLAARRGVAHLV